MHTVQRDEGRYGEMLGQESDAPDTDSRILDEEEEGMPEKGSKENGSARRSCKERGHEDDHNKRCRKGDGGEGPSVMRRTDEERKAYQKHYRETHREERKAYTERNRERINALRRLDYQLNREKLREQARRYYLRNKERMKVARILGVSLTMIDAEGRVIV